jgi:hypothetical protein
MRSRKARILSYMGGSGPVQTVPLDPGEDEREEPVAPIGEPVGDPDEPPAPDPAPDTVQAPDSTVVRDTVTARDTIPAGVS